MSDEARLIRVAQGIEPADLLIRDARIVNVFVGRVIEGCVAVADGKIVGFSPLEARETVDAGGRYLLPGLIDAHIHVESSMLTPGRFAECVLPHGTTTVVADPHELVNVCGRAGVEYFLACAETLPLNIVLALPSCVPAAPFEDAGAVMTAADMMPFMRHRCVGAVGEMMNFPGVLGCDPEVLSKVRLGHAYGKPVNGHAPGVLGAGLDAYCCAGINDTHEASTREEMLAALERGEFVFLRQGSAARNLLDLLPHVTADNARRCAFCSDDVHADHLLTDGHIDHILRLAVSWGLDPIRAVTMATLNAAEACRLGRKGGIAPGWDADLVLVDDLKDFAVRGAWVAGHQVASDGRLTTVVPPVDASRVSGMMNVAPLTEDAFVVRARSGRARVIGLHGGSIVTEALERSVVTDGDGVVFPDRNEGLDLIAVVERHHGSGKVGVGLIEGFGVKDGAIATTVAHDSHNIVVVGSSSEEMRVAVEAVVGMGGGCVLVRRGRIIGRLALPVGGLMSCEQPEHVSRTLASLLALAHGELGVPEPVEPFMSLSFMALPVIPSLKLTARGLFDVDRFKFTSVDLGE